ncbi:serine/threonine-protein kinase pim-2-like [Acanthochromis polyacanthus]|uniref:serine/threonine-protein kinase pim-2-like n=1 Tax=Acanthochromis polyacanthus TaxID=80966 RepID=UPI0022344C0F|nr:serine/threonine-protein kinase pim-2-like [Acanthochromis polyacanthus]
MGKHVGRNGKKLPIEVAAMLKIQAGGAGSVGSSAPISLLDWYDLGQELILVLERPVPSEDLWSYMYNNGGSLEEEKAKIILKQLLDAAIHLEDEGIFHRDVKCENILIETGSEVPRVRLLDFGLCCFTKKRSYYRTFHGAFAHTPPECRTRHTCRPGPTTVFQMGVVLFDMLHGCDAFATFDGLQLRPSSFSASFSADCQDFLTKCFTMFPDRRPKLTELRHHP